MNDTESAFDSDFLKKLEYLYIVSKKIFAGRIKAERRSTRRGVSVEFADYRNYTAGDDFRYIDWNAFARLDELLLKLYEEREDLHIYFLVDASQSMTYGELPKLIYAKRVAAALAYIGLSNLDRIGITAFNTTDMNRLPTERGKGKIFTVLNFLDQIAGTGETDLESAFHNFVHMTKRRGLVVLISDLFDPKGFTAGLNMLKFQKHDLFVIHIIDEKEAEPNLLGDYHLVDVETDQLRPVTINENHIKRYQVLFKKYCDDLDRYCTQREISLVRTMTKAPFEELILRIFRMGGFVS
ncbi:MAG: DUF58 domain-containing protein [Candidatus Poribacteria bacterium]|nr:DUF58 domain-containing protein [Candidatus Poribacteria bacterium]